MLTHLNLLAPFWRRVYFELSKFAHHLSPDSVGLVAKSVRSSFTSSVTSVEVYFQVKIVLNCCQRDINEIRIRRKRHSSRIAHEEFHAPPCRSPCDQYIKPGNDIRVVFFNQMTVYNENNHFLQ